MSATEWTTTPPTEPGWYWAWPVLDAVLNKVVRLIDIDRPDGWGSDPSNPSGLVVWNYRMDYCTDLGEFLAYNKTIRFLGPLTEPVLPE